eukprot:4258640-Prorocentrum_lima.AAC.1
MEISSFVWPVRERREPRKLVRGHVSLPCVETFVVPERCEWNCGCDCECNRAICCGPKRACM